MINCLQPLSINPPLLGSHCPSSTFQGNIQTNPYTKANKFNSCKQRRRNLEERGGRAVVCGLLFPVDPWAPSIDSQSIASQLFAVSLFPYIGFLYFITKSKTAPKLTLFGFYFLLAFVGATRLLWIMLQLASFHTYYVLIATSNFISTLLIFFLVLFLSIFIVQFQLEFMVHYGTSLSNVDWLHGGAESLLTLTNLFIVLGLRQALRKAKSAEESPSNVVSDTTDENTPSN